MKLYHIYNEKFEITSAQFFNEGEQPENAVFVQNCNYIKPMVNPDTLEIYEGATPEEITEEIAEAKRKQAILIDLDYTDRISKLMSKHNDKFIYGIINGVPYNIPSDVIEEKERLKSECNQLILDLGISDFTYRQSNLQLKK